MKFASKDYIINTVFRTNILPVISECNTSCVFCSHKQNPRDVEVFRMPKMSLKDFEELLDFISPNKKIIIGESATRIIEGEPLLYKGFPQIIRMVRERFKLTPVQVTTNGILLTDELIGDMEKLGNIELNISINCVDAQKRSEVLGMKNTRSIEETVRMLRGRIRFSGSMVIVPGLLDYDDVEAVVRLLDSNGGDAVRIFLPGYTHLAPEIYDFADIYDKAHEWLEKLRQKYSIPIIIEPSIIKTLDCFVEGVVKNSAAFEAGLRIGDIIVEVNGNKVFTRVHGFDLIYRAANPVLKVKRGETELKLRIAKTRNSSPGFIVLFDIDPETIKRVENIVALNTGRSSYGGRKTPKVLFITSELAKDIVQKLFDANGIVFDYDIISAGNNYFGGTIKCAGLLTVEDIIFALKEYLKNNERPDLIILPSIMFDFKKRDLVGRSMLDIQNESGITVDIV